MNYARYAVLFAAALVATDASAAISAGIDTSVDQCRAPCLVHFNGFEASSGDGSSATERYHRWHFEWDFGDPGTGSWATTGKSKNRTAGPLAAHLFQQPGTYTVTLKVTDGGEVATAEKTVTVSDWNDTVCVSDNGDFSGCPVCSSGNGNTCITSSDFDSAVVNNDATNRRLLFRSGGNFLQNGQISGLAGGPSLIGTYGGTAKANVNISGFGGTRIILSPGGWRIMDIAFDNNDADDAVIGVKSGALVFRNIATATPRFMLNDPNAESTIPVDIAGVENIISSFSSQSFYCFFGGGDRVVWMGNDCQVQAPGTVRGHNIRVNWSRRLIVSNNLHHREPEDRDVVKIHCTGRDGTPVAGKNCQYLYVGDNWFTGRKNSQKLVQIFREGTAYDDELIQDLVFERNFLRFLDQEVSPTFAAGIGVQRATIRNNICRWTHGGTANYPACIKTFDITNLPPSDYVAIGNTTVNLQISSPTASSGVTLSGSGTEIGENGIFYASGYRTRGEAVQGRDATHLWNTDEISSLPFVDGQLMEPNDYRLNGSAAGIAGSGVDAGALNPIDFDLACRVQPHDPGAFDSKATATLCLLGATTTPPTPAAPEPPVLLE